MEMQKRKADTPADTDHHDRAVRSIVRDFVLGLGRDRAMLPDCVCVFTPTVRSGHRQPGFPRGEGRALGIGFADDHAAWPLNSASVQEHKARRRSIFRA